MLQLLVLLLLPYCYELLQVLLLIVVLLLLLIGLPKTRLASVQSVLNAAARIIARLPPYSHISDYMINELHWLSIFARVNYKVLLLVAKSKQGLA